MPDWTSMSPKKNEEEIGEGVAGKEAGGRRVSALKRAAGSTERESGSRSPRREIVDLDPSANQPPSWPLPTPVQSGTASFPGFIGENRREDPPAWTGSVPEIKSDVPEAKKPRKEGDEDMEEEVIPEPSLTDIMKGINKLSVQNHNHEVHLNKIDHAIQSFQAELACLKESMVTKESFVNLESRVVKLEEKEVGQYSHEIKLLRQQVSKLDPANRGLRLRGFKEDDLDKRRKVIDDLMSKLGLSSS